MRSDMKFNSMQNKVTHQDLIARISEIKENLIFQQ